MEKGKDVRSPNMKSDVGAFLGRRILLPLRIFHLRFLQQRLYQRGHSCIYQSAYGKENNYQSIRQRSSCPKFKNFF